MPFRSSNYNQLQMVATVCASGENAPRRPEGKLFPTALPSRRGPSRMRRQHEAPLKTDRTLQTLTGSADKTFSPEMFHSLHFEGHRYA